ncbi:hypothetical protein L9F63_019874, partial [Diploptera punctata]
SPRLSSVLWDNRNPQNLENVDVILEGTDLWRKFHEVSTEMVITKVGRNMFPVLTVRVTGLEPDKQYYVVMEMCLASDSRYRFFENCWRVAGRAETQLPSSTRLYIHQDSPATGAHWMREPIKMKTAKLTNNTVNSNGQIILTSMHKYIPFIHIVKTSDINNIPWSPTATFSFKETEFIAVTAYQNEEVTKLKINNNPFAKGFRENGLSYTKRKHNEDGSETEIRKRHSSDRSSYSSVESVPSSSTSTDGSDTAERSEKCDKMCCEHSVNNVVPLTSTHCDELTAITNISINTNTIQYPFSGLYPSLYRPHHHQEDQLLLRYPFLFPPPPPPPLLSHYFLPFSYNPPLFYLHYICYIPKSVESEFNEKPVN